MDAGADKSSLSLKSWIYPAIRRKAGFIRIVQQAAPAPKSFNGSGPDGRFIFRIRDRAEYIYSA